MSRSPKEGQGMDGSRYLQELRVEKGNGGLAGVWLLMLLICAVEARVVDDVLAITVY